MKLEVIMNDGSARVIDNVARVLGRDSQHNNPLLLALEYYPGVIIISSANEPEFRERLKEFGTHDVTVVQELSEMLRQPLIL